METRRWKGSPTLEGLQSSAQCGEASGLLCACPTKTNPLFESSSACDRREKWTQKSLHSLLNICLPLMIIRMVFLRISRGRSIKDQKQNQRGPPLSSNYMVVLAKILKINRLCFPSGLQSITHIKHHLESLIGINTHCGVLKKKKPVHNFELSFLCVCARAYTHKHIINRK